MLNTYYAYNKDVQCNYLRPCLNAEPLMRGYGEMGKTEKNIYSRKMYTL